MMNAATWLFWTLGAISLVWIGGTLVLRKADIGEFFSELIRFILFFGFFLWLLQNGPAMATSIIESMEKLGSDASGLSGLSPSSLVNVGFMLWKQAIQNMTFWQPVDSFVGMALTGGILLVLPVIGVNMMLLYASSWVLMYAGIFFLGFGGSKWTSDMAINYFKTVFGTGIQLLTMTLIVGIGNSMLTDFYGKMNKGTLNFEELGVMLVFCIALMMLVSKLPPLVAGIISGSSLGGGGIGSSSTGAVAGAAMTAAGIAVAGAKMAGAAAMGAAQSAVSGASALQAAFQKAQSVTDGSNSSMPSMGGSLSAGSARDGSSSNRSSALASAMGGFAGDAGQADGRTFESGNSASGVGASSGSASIGDSGKLGGTKSGGAITTPVAATSRPAGLRNLATVQTGETAGGKIGAAIKARGTPDAVAAQKTADAISEVEAFVHRDSQAS
jgi:type IV secretion system protein TrbL